MKKTMTVISLLAAALLLSALAGGSAVAQEIKIGYINLGDTFDSYEKTKKYDASLEGKRDTKEEEREKLVDTIRDLKEEMALLSEQGKEEKQRVIDEKIKVLQEFDESTRETLREERDEMVREIFQEIDNVIQDYGKENGYTAILNDRVLLYGDETIDITDDIIEILNAGFKKDKD